MLKTLNYSLHACAGSGIITKTELKLFYTAFMIVGNLGEIRVGFKSFKSFIL